MDPSDDTTDTTSDGTDGETAAVAHEEHPAPARRRRLDGRTLGICVCVAVVGAVLAALLASALLGDDDGGTERTGSDPDEAPIQLIETIDAKALVAIELRTPDGDATSLATLRDAAPTKPMVINIWAQSCAPCLQEMPLLDDASRANPDLAFLGVDNDPQAQLDKAKVMAEKTGITYPWVHDPVGDFSAASQVAAMPTTFILMPSGEVVASKTGEFTSQAELQQWLDDHVA